MSRVRMNWTPLNVARSRHQQKTKTTTPQSKTPFLDLSLLPMFKMMILALLFNRRRCPPRLARPNTPVVRGLCLCSPCSTDMGVRTLRALLATICGATSKNKEAFGLMTTTRCARLCERDSSLVTMPCGKNYVSCDIKR